MQVMMQCSYQCKLGSRPGTINGKRDGLWGSGSLQYQLIKPAFAEFTEDVISA